MIIPFVIQLKRAVTLSLSIKSQFSTHFSLFLDRYLFLYINISLDQGTTKVLIFLLSKEDIRQE